MDSNRYEHLYRLPRKAGRNDTSYALEEILDHADPSIADAYHRSYRVALAVKALQREVEKAVHDPQRSKKLFPASVEDFTTITHNAGFDKELRFDPTTETARVIKGEPSWRTPLIREAQHDPLRMARKHLVDLLGERPLIERMLDCCEHGVVSHRHQVAGDVQQLMMLMADHAVNHRIDYNQEARRA